MSTVIKATWAIGLHRISQRIFDRYHGTYFGG